MVPEQSTLDSWLRGHAPTPLPGSRFIGLGDSLKALVTSVLARKPGQCTLVVLDSGAAARDFIDAFGFFSGKPAADRIHYLPALDFDYYRSVLPNPETLCERNVGLYLAATDPGERVFVTTLASLFQKVPPKGFFLQSVLSLALGEERSRDQLVQALCRAGYQRQPSSQDPGVFAVRGNVLDVFSPLYSRPARIEFFGDFVDTIRFFEPDTQRSRGEIQRFDAVPVGHALIPPADLFEEAAHRVKQRLDDLGVSKLERDALIEKQSNGARVADAGFVFPLLSNGSDPLAAFFPADTVVIAEGTEALKEAIAEREFPRLVVQHGLFEKQPLPVAPFTDLFQSQAEVEGFLDGAAYTFDRFEGTQGGMGLQAQALSINEARQLDEIADRFRAWVEQGYRVHVVFHTRTHAEKFQSLFEPYALAIRPLPDEPSIPVTDRLAAEGGVGQVLLWQGFLPESWVLPGLKAVLISEEAIFGHKRRSLGARKAKEAPTQKLLSQFREMQVGDYVVHKEFGVGRYLGLLSMDFLGVQNDYVLLEYKDGDRLYIPVYRLNVLQKYVSGEGPAPVLDKLGTDRWAKAKGRARRAIAELAAELMKLQAKRKLVPGHVFSEPSAEYRQFEMEFPFDETPDQLRAIEDVAADMSRSYPMDRLICGDVGYGKTEVAMRAALRAVLDKKQVAVLVPTTILAFQHFESFKNRFRNVGVKIELISRMRKPKEARAVLEQARAGQIDILIGTHRLLSADVAFKDLGLVVVDEEHRFGVKDKERLKRLRDLVHVLTLTATPIPRTLNMAMSGIRDISVIATPPQDRLSVRTFVCRSSPEVVREAISNELARGGQVYFVHNRVESLMRVAKEIQDLVPNVRIETGHGQMDAESLEGKMVRFYRNEAQILVCTTIIESGLDIPRANTMIIDRADCMGLAQLYQLRGRVGRSDRRAYCYLLTPGESQITEDAKERLQVIQRYTDLGSGFHIASHDLEIRGAGDLLGKDQSGHLAAVGVDMYFEILEDSIRALKGEAPKVEVEPEITLKVHASFPLDYLPDVAERVVLYRRLSDVHSEGEIADLELEIRDRLGPLPEPVTNLLGLMRIKIVLKRLHVTRMNCGPKRTSLQFASSTPVSPERLVRLVQSAPDRYGLTPDQKFVFAVEQPDWREQLRQVQRLAVTLGVDDGLD